MTNKSRVWLSVLLSLLANVLLLLLLSSQSRVSGGVEYGTYTITGGFPLAVVKGGFAGDFRIINFNWFNLLLIVFQWQFWVNMIFWFVVIFSGLKFWPNKKVEPVGR